MTRIGGQTSSPSLAGSRACVRHERLRINVELNRDLGVLIYSFPMKFIPLDARDRAHVGRHWKRRFLRGVQCILLATMGKVGTSLDFFEAALGKTASEFIEIAMMPDEYIIYRNRHKRNGAVTWRKQYRKLCAPELHEIIELMALGSSGLQRMKEKYPKCAVHYIDSVS